MALNEQDLSSIILSLPPAQRQVVAELRGQYSDLQRHNAELQVELTYSKNRIQELEANLAAVTTPVASIPAPQTNLQEFIAGLKSQHQAGEETIRRKTTEQIHTIDDPSFDAYLALQNSVSRSMKPLPKAFEFVDLVNLKNNLTAEGHVPTSPLQQPIIQDFCQHIDGVRQCQKDSRFAYIFNDAVKMDLLRKMFDMCKTAEAKMGTTAHLSLPPQTVVFDAQALKEKEDIDTTVLRMREFQLHMSRLESCGEVFNRATKEVHTLDDMQATASMLPHYTNEFELILQAMGNDCENLQRNEVVLVEGGSLHIENINTHRAVLLEQASKQAEELHEKHKAIDALFAEMVAILGKVEDGFRAAIQMVQAHGKTQIEIALCDHRIGEMRKAVETEVSKQQRYLEGTKFTTFLCNKARDAYRRLYTNLEESLRSRKELCERTKVASQEQLYTMAEVLHDTLGKRSSADNNQLRTDQNNLENANRALMGLVHMPTEMERQMSQIRELTVSIANHKGRIAQTANDMSQLRQLLNKFGTMSFLKRDTNFLSIYESAEKTNKLQDKLDDATQRIKFVSEMLVEVSDPETRQDYVVQQCLEGLKVSVADTSDLIAARGSMEDFEENYRTQAATRLKRHRRLISHFLDEMREGGNDLASVEPSIEINVVTLLESLDSILSALTHNEEPIPARVRAQFGGGYQDPQSMDRAGSMASMAMQRHGTFGGGSRGASVASGGGQGGGGGGDNFIHRTTGQQDTQEVQENELAHHTFARYSSKLKVGHDLRKLVKPGTGIELSNTSALGAVGFRLGSGIHFYTIRIGASCMRLLVGFADWNLPLDGYCNSLKYSGCYYLHVGNGTIWAPDQKIERKQFTYEAIGSAVGSVLKCVIDTNERTISYIWNDMNLGVAFRNVNLTRTLYPSFEIFSNGCAFEFTGEEDTARKAEGAAQAQ